MTEAAAPARLATEDRKRKFCEFVSEGLTAGDAAKATGVARRTVFYWRQGDAAFARAWEEAEQLRVEALEAAAHRLALSGDAVMLKFLLSNLAPEKYSERARLDVTSGGAPLHLSELELATRVVQVLSAAQHAPASIAHNAEPIEDVEWHAVEDVDDLV
ncbi:MAG TPA: hypothetical protein PJ986_14125 [Gammaproteobacteria bacterium]|nr:hypothetical protein [Gammaproteobacteria bacterium]